MWNQNPIEVLKLLAEFAIPVTIAIFGFLINGTIQRQNAIAQRQSSWFTKWADDFLKTANSFNDSATSFMLLYAASEWKVNNNLQRAVEEQKLLSNEILPLILVSCPRNTRT
jgi:hypothetical protein